MLLPEDVREVVWGLENKMRSWPMKCKFVEKENLHLNFSFLGEIKEEDVEKIKKKLNELAKQFSPFKIQLNGIKPIPSKSFVRVLALDVIDESGKGDLLRKKVVEKIGGDSKPLHVTLCRVKWLDKKNVLESIESEHVNVSFIVDRIQLIKSVLRREGPLYSVLHSAQLG